MKSAEQIKAELVAPMMDGFNDLSSAEQTLVCEAEILYDAAEKTGGFRGWALAWLQYCEATERHPLTEPQTLLDYADIDRHCGYRLSQQVMEWERAAFMKVMEREAA